MVDERLADVIPSDELAEIVQEYASGGLSKLETAMGAYMPRRRADVLRFYEQMRTTAPDATLDAAVCAYILSSNTLTPREDMEDQREEIKREVWYQGEKGNYDHAAIMSEWITTYASGWRQHRMRTLLWLYQRRREQYLGMLHAVAA